MTTAQAPRPVAHNFFIIWIEQDLNFQMKSGRREDDHPLCHYSSL
jgi:hypothetical protein